MRQSFVKHTFSCVNGTVFNQMSFTCTRYQDSIPCETSSNYFYLNKRNGDPKAYFLTDEDIVKPITNGQTQNQQHQPTQSNQYQPSRHSLSNYNFSTFTQPININNNINNNNNNQRSTISIDRPSSIQPRTIESTYQQQPQRTSTTPLVNSNTSPIRIIHKSIEHQPVHNYGSLMDELDDNSIINNRRPTYNRKASAPYEFTSKYGSTNSNSNQIKPGVRYSVGSSSISSSINTNANKYETMKKSYDFDSAVSPTYVEQPEPEYKPSSSIHSTVNRNEPQYRSLLQSNFNKPSSSKMDHMINSYDVAIDEHGKDSLNFPRPQQTTSSPLQSIERNPIKIIQSPQQLKKKPFTPAAFSKLYVESQKSSKYSPQTQLLYNNRNTVIDNSYNHQHVRTTAKPFEHNTFHGTQSKPATTMYSTTYTSSGDHQLPTSNEKDDLLPFPKYNSMLPTDGNVIKSNQYMIPSSIRIIEPNEPARKEQQHQQQSSSQPSSNNKRFPEPYSLNNRNVEPPSITRQHSSADRQELPVKMSFVNKNSNGDKNQGSQIAGNFGNLRVIKQVKGKSLLIDPSLENDPARDNIIAQVLEMLNKYN